MPQLSLLLIRLLTHLLTLLRKWPLILRLKNQSSQQKKPDPRSVMRFPPQAKSALQSNASHATRVPTSPITHESE